MNKPIQKITPFLWFDNQAEEAAAFYTSIFKDSKVETVTRYGEAGPGPKGSAMTVVFQIEGQQFIALNGGPQFKFTEAISFVVNCQTQPEIDELWEKLTDGGEEVRLSLPGSIGFRYAHRPTRSCRESDGNRPGHFSNSYQSARCAPCNRVPWSVARFAHRP